MLSVRWWVTCAALACFAAAGCATSGAQTTVYVVRHAEKATGDDPDLTERGVARAEALGLRFAAGDLDAVYATQYKRTQQTVRPTARVVGLDVVLVTAQATGEFARGIRQRHRGQRVLAAAHSNTVPALLKALGVRQPIVIEETDYGDLFVVTLYDDGRAVLRRERFGD